MQYALTGGRVLNALGPLDVTIAAGEFVSLVGPSGCGKSTLVRILAGLQPPSDGQAFVDGKPMHTPSAQVAVMFQDANLMPWRTVKDNICLPLELMGIEKTARYAQAEPLLHRLGLGEFATTYPHALSGGMAQRVALGRVLIQRPQALLLDEPFGALDAFTREQVSIDLLDLWTQQQLTVLMITHDIHEAVLLSDRVLVMSKRPGKLVADVRIDLPRPRQPADQYSAAFGQYAAAIRAALQRA
jgi:NitT/TauT family transport system ATP-binding protein